MYIYIIFKFNLVLRFFLNFKFKILFTIYIKQTHILFILEKIQTKSQFNPKFYFNCQFKFDLKTGMLQVPLLRKFRPRNLPRRQQRMDTQR